jgi:Mg2+ and Co2+ transporter CorA
MVVINESAHKDKIFNLIAQRDAEQSILLAKSSTLLARAAQQDSSSMKAIAVLTMAILPATFFATLFSMPLLNWNLEVDKVVQPQFWVYLAFTLPATALAFCTWGFLIKVWLRLRGKPALEDIAGSDKLKL